MTTTESEIAENFRRIGQLVTARWPKATAKVTDSAFAGPGILLEHPVNDLAVVLLDGTWELIVQHPYDRDWILVCDLGEPADLARATVNAIEESELYA
ncbi:hypothetical protein [Streptomyces alkaliterrae]|uniref:Uncharacterized protein n=1 Tax=Streptomyces alkaliterrae TaxID=2213162 RepID=A0A5P0YPA0_9ACTN|nr:hypothetical protein [Streptomyces alkaliterrae]MBB1260172.1 hypothetical protein [Streptomyces alkaliterrae]MQS02085.1 hypothetical protein [Streptomyces alkaliterrae]